MARTFPLALALTLTLCSPAFAAQAKPVAAKYPVEIPKSDYVPYTGQFVADFPDALAPGVGAGLALANGQGSGVFLTTTGRGPTAEGPKFHDKSTRKPAAGRFFPAPSYAPGLEFVRLDETGARLVKSVPLRYEAGKNVTGRPVPLGQPGATGETALGDDLTVLPGDPAGLCPSAAAPGPAGSSVWIADEYGPFLLAADSDTGRITARLGPGEGLPEILTLRQDNKGFSGLAVTPSGKVLLCLRAALNADGSPRESKAVFIRLVEYDPASGKTRMFAYPIEQSAYRRTYDAQIGSLACLGETRFALIEQGKDKNGHERNVVVVIDLAQASDISGLKTQDGAPLEFAIQPKALESLGVVLPKRAEVLDLRAVGLTGQATGLAISADRATLYVSQAGDGGLATAVENPAQTESGAAVKTPSFYTFDAKKRIWYVSATVGTKFVLKPTASVPLIWRVQLNEHIAK
jgi:hypothetical protein